MKNGCRILVRISEDLPVDIEGDNIKMDVQEKTEGCGWINLLKPSSFFTYHQVELSKILHGARFALSVLYGFQNKQRLFPYTPLTDWLL